MPPTNYAGPVLKNVIYHLEDDPYVDSFYELFAWDAETVFGQKDKPIIIKSDLFEDSVDESLDKSTEEEVLLKLERNGTIGDIIRKIHDAKGKPVIVSMDCGVVARKLIENGYIPSAIITDRAYFMNGLTTIYWLLEHGFQDYLPLGLSGTRIESDWPYSNGISDFEKKYYGVDGGTPIPNRYFYKGNRSEMPFYETLAATMKYHLEKFGIKKI